MLTIFTIPKPFTESHINRIQKNAIRSWQLVVPGCQIILIGNDQGVKEAALELGVLHVSEVKYNEYDTPLLNSAFSLARHMAKNPRLAYINCDIILLDDFSTALNILPVEIFLAVGRRWDLDIDDPIDFTDSDWQSAIRKKVMESGRLHSAAGIDYFIFNKESFTDLPPFAVGRVGWDNWMIYQAKKSGMKVIDLSRQITAIHQNHGYPDKNKGAERKNNPEAQKNFSFIPSPPHRLTIDDANYFLAGGKIKKRYLHLIPFWKRYAKQRIKMFFSDYRP